MLTIGKMLRPGCSHMSAHDAATVKELKANLKLYLLNDIVMLDYIRILNKKYKKENIDRENREKLIKSFMNVSPEIRKKAGVSSQDYDRIVMLMKLDWEIFLPESKMHPKNYWNPRNEFDAFVDFTRLPKKLEKNAKMLLYRPQEMAKLKKSFDAVLSAAESEELRRMQEKEQWKEEKYKTLEFYRRPLPKPASEIELIQDLLTYIDDFFEKEAKERAQINKDLKAMRKADPESFSEEMFQIKKEEEELFYQDALTKLLKERRKTPKEERIKMRQDSVDEINTTDLETWVIRPQFALLGGSDEFFDREGADAQPLRAVDARDYEKVRKAIWQNNRVDFARMYLNKGEPYTLRKYKKIFKREMEKRAQLYDVLDQDG